MSDFNPSSIISSIISSEVNDSRLTEGKTSRNASSLSSKKNAARSGSYSSIISDKNNAERGSAAFSTSSIISGLNSELSNAKEGTNDGNNPISASSFLKKVNNLDTSSSINTSSSVLTESDSKPSLFGDIFSTIKEKDNSSSSIGISDNGDDDNDIISTMFSSSLKKTDTYSFNPEKDPVFPTEIENENSKNTEHITDNISFSSDSPPVNERSYSESRQESSSTNGFSDILSSDSMFKSSHHKRKKSLNSSGSSASKRSSRSKKSHHSSKYGSSIISDSSILSNFSPENTNGKPKVTIESTPTKVSSGSSPYSMKTDSNSPISGMFIADDDGVIIDGEKKKKSPKNKSPISSSSPSDVAIPELRTKKMSSESSPLYSAKNSPESDIISSPGKSTVTDIYETPKSKVSIESDSSGLGIFDNSFDEMLEKNRKKSKNRKESNYSDILSSSLSMSSTNKSSTIKSKDENEKGHYIFDNDDDSILSGFGSDTTEKSSQTEHTNTDIISSNINDESDDIISGLNQSSSERTKDESTKTNSSNYSTTSSDDDFIDAESSVINRVIVDDRSDFNSVVQSNIIDDSNVVDGSSVLINIESSALVKNETKSDNEIQSSSFLEIDESILDQPSRSTVKDSTLGINDSGIVMDSISIISENTQTNKNDNEVNDSSDFIDFDSSVVSEKTTTKNETQTFETSDFVDIESSIISEKTPVRGNKNGTQTFESNDFIDIESSIVSEESSVKDNTQTFESSDFVDVESFAGSTLNKESTIVESGYSDFITESTFATTKTKDDSTDFDDFVSESTTRRNSTADFDDFVSESTTRRNSTADFDDFVSESTTRRNSTADFDDFVSESTQKSRRNTTSDFSDFVTDSSMTQNGSTQARTDELPDNSILINEDRSKFRPSLTPRSEFVLNNIYSMSIPAEKVQHGKFVTETQTQFSMKPAKHQRVKNSGSVPLFDPMILSSAKVSDINARYKETLVNAQQKLMLLGQSIDSLLLTKQSRQERKRSKGITMDSVEKEIEEKIRKKRERAKRLEGKFV